MFSHQKHLFVISCTLFTIYSLPFGKPFLTYIFAARLFVYWVFIIDTFFPTVKEINNNEALSKAVIVVNSSHSNHIVCLKFSLSKIESLPCKCSLSFLPLTIESKFLHDNGSCIKGIIGNKS